MADSGEVVQLNLHLPSELAGHLRTLARGAGEKTHPYVIGVIEKGADSHLAAIGREAFMGNLMDEHRAEEALFTARFDELEQHD